MSKIFSAVTSAISSIIDPGPSAEDLARQRTAYAQSLLSAPGVLDKSNPVFQTAEGQSELQKAVDYNRQQDAVIAAAHPAPVVKPVAPPPPPTPEAAANDSPEIQAAKKSIADAGTQERRRRKTIGKANLQATGPGGLTSGSSSSSSSTLLG